MADRIPQPSGGRGNPRGTRGKFGPGWRWNPMTGFFFNTPPSAGATPPPATTTPGYYGYGGGLGSYGTTAPATTPVAGLGTYAGQQTMPRFGYGYTLGPSGWGAIPTAGGYSGGGGAPPTGNAWWGEQLAAGNGWQYGLTGANRANLESGEGIGYNRWNTPAGFGVGYDAYGNMGRGSEWFEIGAGGNPGMGPAGGKRGREVSAYGLTPNPNNPAGYGSRAWNATTRPSKHKQSPQGMERFPWMNTGPTSGTSPAWLQPMTMWRPG